MLLRVLPPGLYLSTGTVTLTLTGEAASFGQKRNLYTHEVPFSVAGNTLHVGYSEHPTPSSLFFNGATLPYNTRMSASTVSACTGATYPNFPPTACTTCNGNTDCTARFRLIDSSAGVAASCDYFSQLSTASAALYCTQARFLLPHCLLWSGYLDTTQTTFQTHRLEESRYSCAFYPADNSVSSRKTCDTGFYSIQGFKFCKVTLPGYYATSPGGILPSLVSDKCGKGFICQPQVDTTIVNTLECAAGSSGVLEGQHEYAQTCVVNDAGVYDSGSVQNCPGGTVCPRGSTSTITCMQGTASAAQSAEHTACIPCIGGDYCKDGTVASTPASESSAQMPLYYRLLGYRGTYFSTMGQKLNSGAMTPVPFRYFKDDSQSGTFDQLCPDGTTPLGTSSHSQLACLTCNDLKFCSNSGGSYSETTCATQVCQRNLMTGEGCERGSKEDTTQTPPVLNQYHCEVSDAGTAREVAGGSAPGDDTACLAGSFCPAGSPWKEMYSCSPSTYNANTSMDDFTDCLACNDGKICKYGSISAAPADCTLGQYCLQGIVHYCDFNTRTPAAASTASSDCADCPAGKYCDMLENTDGFLDDCRDGWWSPGSGNQCAVVPENQITNSAKDTLSVPGDHQLSKNSAFLPCPDGKQCSAGATQDCPVGSKCNYVDNWNPGQTILDGPQSCLVGENCPAGTATETNCPPGGYTESVTSSPQCPNVAATFYHLGDRNKTPCPDRFFCPAGSQTPSYCGNGLTSTGASSSASSDCSNCPATNYCLDSIVQSCGQAGFICVEGSTLPDRCPAGKKVASAGQTACVDCQESKYCPFTAMSVISDDYLCEAGYYCPTGSSSRREQDCTQGNFCPKGSATPTSCPQGKYFPQTRAQSADDCLICPAGSYCSGVAVTSVSGPCKAGYWCPEGSTVETQNDVLAGYYSESAAIMQLPCLHGSFSAANNAQTCTSCTAGKYCEGTALTDGVACPVGQYCPEGSIYPKFCSLSTFQAGTSKTASSECLTCTAGKWCGSSGLSAVSGDCQAGSFCKQGASHDRPIAVTANLGICPAGHYCGTSTENPAPCGTGKYLPSKGAKVVEECLDCDEGSYCQTTGLTAVTQTCAAGTACAEGAASESACTTDNYYCPAKTGVELKCPDGQERSGGATTCSNCEEGYYCFNATKTPCPAGYYCPTGSTGPTSCPIKTYNPATQSTSSTACLTCTAGHACPYAGMSAQITCASGYYCNADNQYEKPIDSASGGTPDFGYYTDGQTTHLCNSGYVCNRKMLTDPADSSILPRCATSYLCNFGTAPVIVSRPREAAEGGTLCPAGSKCATDLGTSALCTGGEYGPSTGATSCVECPYGFGCKDGGTAPLDECTAGHYCTKGTTYVANAIQETACQAGYKCPQGTHQQLVCPAGQYQPSATSSDCIPCDAGFYCPPSRGARDASAKTACPAGHKCPSAGMTRPLSCVPGQYQDQTQQTSCKVCEAGKYCPESEMTDLSSWGCPAGYFCPTGSKDLSNICQTGNYCPANSSSMTPCDVGKYCAEEALSAISGTCESGYICLGSATKPNPTDGTTGFLCTQGSYCLAGASTVTPCPINTYMPYKGAKAENECISCSAGQVCSSTGLTAPSESCPAGKYCENSSTQTDCPVGYQCPAGTHLPILCQPGTVQTAAGQSSCLPCQAGNYCTFTATHSNTYEPSVQITEQLTCPEGYFCPAGSDIYFVNECPAGTYGASTGLSSSSECTSCPATKYCEVSGLTTSDLTSRVCADGYLCPTGSSTESATLCPKHSHCIAGVETACPAGTYTYSTGTKRAADCIPCAPGLYCPTRDQNPFSCPAGKTCAKGLSAASEAIDCPSGSYCPTGSSVPTSCEIGSYNPSTGQSACSDCPAGKYCPTLGLSSDGTLCPSHFVCATGSHTFQTCAPSTYESGGSCVACPSGAYCWPTGSGSNNKGACDDGFVCQGSSYTSQPYTAVNINSNHQDFNTYNGRAIEGYYANQATQNKNTACTAGTYQNSAGTSACKPCPEGYYCPNTAMTDTDLLQCSVGLKCGEGLSALPSGGCTAGRVCEIGATYPTLCPDGQIPKGDNTGCDLCPTTKYCAVSGGSTVENDCISGSICTSTGLKVQPLCPGGTKLNSAGTGCETCPAGRFCIDGSDSGPCISGYECGPGQEYPNKNAQRDCPIGYYCLEGTTDPATETCPTGKYISTTGAIQLTDCKACEPGYICANTIPSACGLGSYCTLFDTGTNQETLACPAGTYGQSNLLAFVTECTVCSPGTQCPGPPTCTTVGSSTSCVGQIAQTPCGKGNYCEEGSTGQYVCHPGTYANTTGTVSADQCKICPQGSFCGAGSIDPTSCTNGNYCPTRTELAIRTCGGGYHCNSTNNFQQVACPENHYCPPGTATPIPCQTGQVCPQQSSYYQSCGLGKRRVSTSSGGYSCVDCEAGTYSDSFLNDECHTCTAGYYCPGGTTKKYPGSLTNHKGTICPAGYYCPAGSGSPSACPKGTYRASTGATSVDDCLRCPVNTFSANVGSTRCLGCGPDATSQEGSFTCSCVGKFRAFSPADSMCRCQPGYNFIKADGSIGDTFGSSSFACEPISVARCGSTEVRTRSGACRGIHDCPNCASGGTRNRITGVCQCKGEDSLDNYCNAGCRSTSQQISITATNSILINNNAVSLKSESAYSYTGSVVCNYPTKGCNMRYSTFDTNGLFGSFNPPSPLTSTHNLLEVLSPDQNRHLATSTGSTLGNVPSPLVCLNQGDSMLFQITSATNYPVYDKDSLLNTNPNFDYSSFLTLATSIASKQSVASNLASDGVTFVTPVLFGYTFDEAGSYVFVNANSNSPDDTMIITVMAESERCPSSSVFQLQTASTLGQHGVTFRDEVYQRPDHLQIVFVIFFFIIGVSMIVLAQQLFSKLSWRIKRSSKPYFRGRQKKYDLRSLGVTSEFYRLTKPGYERFEQLNQRHGSLWAQEEEDLDDLNLNLIPDIEKEVENLMEKYDERSKKSNKKRKGILEALEGLENRLEELKLANDREVQAQIMRERFMNGRRGAGNVLGQLVEKVNLERKEDIEALKKIKKEQKKLEEEERRDNKVIERMQRRQDSLEERIQNNPDLNEREKEKLLLEMAENEKEMQQILMDDRERQEADFRRLLNQRAERKKRNKQEAKQLIQKLEAVDQSKDPGAAQTQKKLQEQIVEHLDKDQIDKVNEEIEKEKLENLKEIEEEVAEKRRQLQNDYDAEKARVKGKEMLGELEKDFEEKNKTLSEERDKQRLEMMKQLEARKRKKLFDELKQKALDEVEAGEEERNAAGDAIQSALQLIGNEDAKKKLEEKQKTEKKELEEMERVQQQEMERLLEQQENELKAAEENLEEELNQEVEEEFESARKPQDVEEQKQKIEEEKEELEAALQQGGRDQEEAKRMMEELRKKNEELTDLILGEQEEQFEGLQAKLARRKELKKKRMQQMREKQMQEQMEMAESHKNRIKEKRRQKTQEEIDIILAGLEEKYVSQKDGSFSLEDFIKLFEEVLNEKMLQETGELLAKQIGQKEQQLSTLGNNKLQNELNALEEQRAEFERQKEELRGLNLAEEIYEERYRNLMIKQENEGREREIVRTNEYKERQNELLKQMEQQHMAEQVELREKQTKNRLHLFKKYIADHTNEGRKEQLEKELGEQLEAFKKEKSKDYQRVIHQMDVEKEILQQELERELENKVQDYEELLRMQEQEERELKEKREHVRALIEQKKNRLAARLEKVQKGADREKAELLSEHQRALDEVQGALENERVRQLALIQATMERRKRMKDFKKEKRQRNVMNFVGMLQRPTFERQKTVMAKYAGELKQWSENVERQRIESSALGQQLFEALINKREVFPQDSRPISKSIPRRLSGFVPRVQTAQMISRTQSPRGVDIRDLAKKVIKLEKEMEHILNLLSL